jgi:CHAT domain-containing protein/Tfp pilus assembly protein PilF
LLDESRESLKEQRPEEALAAADRALAAATEAGDQSGLGYAHRARARALEVLDRPHDALAARARALVVWGRLGAQPERIEELCARAMLFVRLQEEQDAAVLVEEAVGLAQSEVFRRLATMRALNDAAEAFWRVWRSREAESLARAALVIGEKYAPNSMDVAQSLHNLGHGARTRNDFVAAADYFERALAIRVAQAPGSMDVAESLHSLGSVAYRQGDLANAIDYHERALAIQERLAPGSIDVSASLNSLGGIAYAQGDLVAARDYFERGLAIREKLAPGSTVVLGSLNNLGAVALRQGDLVAAKGFFERALSIGEKRNPGSSDVAISLIGLGNVASLRGDLLKARDNYERGLAIQEKLVPGSIQLAMSLNNLGGMAYTQGEMAKARDYYLRALAIRQELVPGSIDVAASLSGLGLVAEKQGDLVAAKDFHKGALAIQEKHAPESLDVAWSLRSLGGIAYSQGSVAMANDYYLRALAIQEKHAPGSMESSVSLNNLGGIAYSEKNVAKAHDYYMRALAIQEKHAPGSIYVAGTFNNLGLVAESQGDLVAAKQYHERALAIGEKHAPGSLELARSHSNLGLLAENQGDLEEAEQKFMQAWQIVRERRRAVLGDEAGRAFAAKYTFHATALVRVRLARGKTVAAFEALEEGRAQGLLQLLSERGLASAGVDTELWQRYEAAEDSFETAAVRLGEASTNEVIVEREVADLASDVAAESELAAKQKQLAEATEEREDALSAYTRARLEKQRLLGEVRRRVPGLEPRRFSFDEARRALPPDAVFVTFSLGEDEGAVFAIPSDPEQPVIARTMPLGEAELSSRVAALRTQIGPGGVLRGIGGLAKARSEQSAAEAELIATSRALFDDLFPAEARAAIETAERVIVSPDGPLWELPFAALVTNASGKPAWLGLEKRLSYTPSLTVLAEMPERDPASAARSALVVGDPVFVRAAEPVISSEESMAKGGGSETTVAPTTPTSISTVLRGERLYLASGGTAPARLPATAVEARGVAALYNAQPLLGEAATEAAVREKLPRASVVHLATHGYLHPHLAMASGVLLTPPAGETAIDATDDDGALQAWEFGTSLPLHADLVVLSACETGRGEAARGEGLVGLTRALQAAGARSVVATHWQVADEAAAELMVRFHELLREGAPKDEALRKAMKVTAEREQTAHPFFWAPFFLTGDPDHPLTLAE